MTTKYSLVIVIFACSVYHRDGKWVMLTTFSRHLGQLPDSPPDSGSEQLLSPVRSHGTPSDHPGGLSPPTGLPGSDLTSVDYTVPMQLLQEQEQLRDSGRTSTLTSTSVGTTSDIGGYHGGAVVVQPHQQQVRAAQKLILQGVRAGHGLESLMRRQYPRVRLWRCLSPS